MRTLVDDQTGCVYLELKDRKSVRTVERDNGRIVLDFGRGHKLIGVEILDETVSQDALYRISKEFDAKDIITYDPAWAAKKRYWRLLSKRDKPCPGTRVYVLVNKKILTPIQWGVQASHSIAGLMNQLGIRNKWDFGLTNKVSSWASKYKTLIFLQCDLRQEKYLRKHSGLRHYQFREPDLGNRWTATAFEPVDKETGAKIFGHLRRV